MFSSLFNPKLIKIEFNEPIRFTKNLFDSLDELRTATLHLSEENESGDCLCVVNGKYLVDIDHRDIKSKSKVHAGPDFAETMEKVMETMLKTKRPEKTEGYCDGCEHLFMSESNQDLLKKMGYSNIPDHKCSLTLEILKHNGQHPRIPKPTACPIKK